VTRHGSSGRTLNAGHDRRLILDHARLLLGRVEITTFEPGPVPSGRWAMGSVVALIRFSVTVYRWVPNPDWHSPVRDDTNPYQAVWGAVFALIADPVREATGKRRQEPVSVSGPW